MEIQGMTNDEHNEIRIIVKLDSPQEFAAFNHYFEKMIEQMANECDATAFSVLEGKYIGKNEGTEEETKEAMKKFAEELVQEANKTKPDKLRINFF